MTGGSCEVLVVGAGPTGLTVAVSLARCGVDVRIVEQALEPIPAARATAYLPRTLEIFDDLGVIAEMLAGTPADSSMRMYRDGAPIARGGAAVHRQPTPQIPYPTVARPLPTWRVEEVLRSRLADFGKAVEFGRRLVGLEQGDEGVMASIERVEDASVGWGHALVSGQPGGTGEIEQVRARYVVGADGGRGATRDLAGLEYRHGEGANHVGFLAELQIDGLEPTVARTYTTSDGRSLHLNPIPHSRSVQLNAQLQPAADGTYPALTVDLAQDFLDTLVGPGLTASDMTWKSLWTVREAVATSYRSGLVFIAGDAAHIHSPLGGQGANTGIADGYNLGWKLAYVVNGWATEAVLDTYDAERRPIADELVARVSAAHRATFGRASTGERGRERPAPDYGMLTQLAIAYPDSALSGPRLTTSPTAGDRAPDGRVVEASTGDRLRLFDLFRGHHFTLLLFGADLAALGSSLVDRYRGRVRSVVVKGIDARVRDVAGTVVIDPDGDAAAAYQAAIRPVVLVRPDGYLSFHGRPEDTSSLLTHLDRILGPC